MQIFSHKDAGSHHLLLTYFLGVNIFASEYICAYSTVPICKRQWS